MLSRSERDNLKKRIETASCAETRWENGGYVYLIRGKFRGKTLYKIGQSVNPRNRASQLRHKHPGCGAVVRHTIHTDSAKKLELAMHYIFEEKRGLGPSREWFELDLGDITWIVRFDYLDMKGF